MMCDADRTVCILKARKLPPVITASFPLALRNAGRSSHRPIETIEIHTETNNEHLPWSFAGGRGVSIVVVNQSSSLSHQLHGCDGVDLASAEFVVRLRLREVNEWSRMMGERWVDDDGWMIDDGSGHQ